MERAQHYRKKAHVPFSGERLRKARKLRKMNQTELGRAIGTQQGRISEHENDRIIPDAITLDKLAGALNCSLDYLFKRSDEIEVLQLSRVEKAALDNFRAGNKNAFDDAMLSDMNGPFSDG